MNPVRNPTDFLQDKILKNTMINKISNGMKKTKTKIMPRDIIENKILLIRSKKVMLDRDLAALYGVKSIRLREQIKRNKERFPEDFMFQLTASEADFLVSQNAIPSKKSLGGSLPYVFTEHGALMAVCGERSVLEEERSVSEMTGEVSPWGANVNEDFKKLIKLTKLKS